jgi:hypothetical protein
MTAQPFPRSDETGAEAPRKGRRHSYNESLDEPAKLISDEPVDVEKEPRQKRTSRWNDRRSRIRRVPSRTMNLPVDRGGASEER